MIMSCPTDPDAGFGSVLRRLAAELRRIERQVEAEVKIRATAIGDYATMLERAAENVARP